MSLVQISACKDDGSTVVSQCLGCFEADATVGTGNNSDSANQVATD